MTTSRQPEDKDFNRKLRRLDRRVSRLEDTQPTGRELNESFEQVYEEIDALEAQINLRFDALETNIHNEFASLNTKFDLIMRRLTGEDRTPNS